MTKEKPKGATEKSESSQNLEKRIQAVNDYKEMTNVFIKTALTKGVDYGSIKMKKKTREGKPYEVESKATLFKAGAEKFIDLDQARAEWFRDDDTWEMLGMTKGTICFICFLKNKDNQTIGEGRGVAVVNPNSEGNFMDFDANKQVKIAKKRAMVDAVLTTYSLSERFTQDLEDMPRQNGAKDTVKPKTKVTKEESDSLLKEVRPAIESLNTAKTPEQVKSILATIVESEKYQGKAIYLIRQHADKRVVALK